MHCWALSAIDPADTQSLVYDLTKFYTSLKKLYIIMYINNLQQMTTTHYKVITLNSNKKGGLQLEQT